MAPSATTTQPMSSKIKRPMNIQTNGINSSTSSPSPSMSASRLPGGAKYPPNSATSNGLGSSGSGARSATRPRRDTPGQLLGRGQRNSSVGLRSASIAGDLTIPHVAEPQPYIKSDEYILKKYRGNPPSLIIHLHPAHFRFDQHEGSFSYKSPMRIMIEHLKLRTIPHDLVDFFATSNVPHYEGCMIVQIFDHKSLAPSQSTSRMDTGPGKTVPFSIHNSNAYLTPSPYVPFPTDSQGGPVKGAIDGLDDSGKAKSAEQKDKENMPAPAFPIDGTRGKASAQAKKPKVTTIVLHPTPISNYADMALKAADARSNSIDAKETRHEVNGPLSATVPPTPVTAIPPSTPITSMAPPAKRFKKTKVDLDSSNIHAAEAQITLATTAPLILDVVSNATESAALLKALAHPMHSDKPPSPKTRKRTVAEMEADEALAAEQERYMLILDERLSTVGAQGGANHADGDGQAGGASFEPRFERFKTLENIKNQHEENKKALKAQQAEQQRKETQDKEREKLRKAAESREQERVRQMSLQQQATSRQRQAAMAAAQHQSGVQGVPQPGQNQNPLPQANVGMVNGIQGQPARFHQQQVSQAQVSSPIVRNGTPQNHSSPVVNNMGNVPMQQTTSSMGGSPPRPGSVVHQNHPQMGAPGMVAQRSQQSHAGTPRMINATPNQQSTPRPMNQTPRMSQASPLQGQMAPAPNPLMMGANGVQMTQQQMMMQQQMLQRRMQQQQALQNMAAMNGQPMNAQQQQLVMLRQQQMAQAQAQAQQHANQMPNNAGLAQNYQAQMAAMASRQQNGMPANVNFNSPGMSNNMAALQMHQAQQMLAQQQVQAQAQAHAQAQAQAHAQQGGQMNVASMTPQQQMQLQVQRQAQQLFQQQVTTLRTQYPNGAIPQEMLNQIKLQAQANATSMVQQQMQRRRMMQQQQQQQMQNMQQMNGGMHMNGQQPGI